MNRQFFHPLQKTVNQHTTLYEIKNVNYFYGISGGAVSYYSHIGNLETMLTSEK